MAAFRYAKRFAVRALPGRPVGATGEGDAALGHPAALPSAILGILLRDRCPHWTFPTCGIVEPYRKTVSQPQSHSPSAARRGIERMGSAGRPSPSVSALAGHPPSCTSLWPRYV